MYCHSDACPVEPKHFGMIAHHGASCQSRTPSGLRHSQLFQAQNILVLCLACLADAEPGDASEPKSKKFPEVGAGSSGWLAGGAAAQSEGPAGAPEQGVASLRPSCGLLGLSLDESELTPGFKSPTLVVVLAEQAGWVGALCFQAQHVIILVIVA